MFHIEVQFPGTPKTYGYTSPLEPVLGQRCVVPTIIKKDGSVALSIATILTFGPVVEGAKPIVALLDDLAIARASEFVLAQGVQA
jgi:hypothetical protein